MNQREIKFRAWDEKKKEIRDVTGINWYDEYIWVDETPMTGDKLPIESTPLMQYTGLKDKNGVEIYEGDIMEEVVKNQHGIFKKVFVFPAYEEFSGGGMDYSVYGIGYSWDDHTPINLSISQIIGNIWENADLLK